VKRGGVLVDVDATEVIAAAVAYAAVHKRSGWSWPETRD
jgi:hypothetical protein